MTDIGALFDWDGVVIDSSAAHERSWELLADEAGLPLFEGHFEQTFGKRNVELIPDILKWSDDPKEIARLGDRKEALYRDIIRDEGIAPLPGVRELLSFFRDQDIPCCVGSSTPRLNVETIMDVLGFREYFADITAAEDVTRGKPAPDVFVTAAKKIQRDPKRCFVFEDALHGIEAGLAAGAIVVAVATTHPLAELSAATLAVHRLSDLDPQTLLAHMR